MSEWISVKDRLPDEGVLVFTFTPEDSTSHGMYDIDFDYIDGDCESPVWYNHNENYEHYSCVAKGDFDAVGPKQDAPYTHWMPLPEPPREN